MNIQEIQGDENLRRREFPVSARQVFLAHAGVCPLPRRVAEAVANAAHAGSAGDQEAELDLHLIRQTREAGARLLHCQPSEIALVGPTSLGLSFVAGGLPWRRGDNVLVYFDDYPSNVYPWMALADRGVEVRLMNVRELGRVRLVDVQGQVDEDTRLVALASCHYLSGWRIPLEAIGRFLRSRRILFCLDAIQTLGAFPTPVDHVDFLAADAHKWLLGPCGAGLLYVRRDIQERLAPIALGWHNVVSPNLLTQEHMRFRDDARRFEPGSHTYVALAGLKACLDLILETGVAAIATDLLEKRAYLEEKLHSRGYTVLSAGAPQDHSGGMISIHKPDADIAALHARLRNENIITSLRVLPTQQRILRVSPHFYNTRAELDRLIESL